MKCLLPLAFCLGSALPAAAWEFTPGAVCVLTHTEPGVSMALTHDPAGPLYTITVTRARPWPDAPIFAMQFDGPRPIAISTTAQSFSADRRSLTVSDTGFGNVLNGLQFNFTASAFLGDAAVVVSLANASEPVQKFRECDQRGLV